MPAPRLLDKRVINAEVATQRKQDAAQGLALAKKVDVLRETVQEEEGKLSQFRDTTIKKVQAEIDAKIQELDGLTKEILTWRERLAEEKSQLGERVKEVGRREEYIEERYEMLENIINEVD